MDYIIKERNDGVLVEGIRDFDAAHIFECGQCFRWERCPDGSYTVVAFEKVINVKAQAGGLMIKNASLEDFEQIWRVYFDLERDYGEIKRALSEKDRVMQEAVAFGNGIRILNQDEWETLVSFILSQNRNIPLIKKSIEALSQSLGTYLGEFQGKPYFSFPKPERLVEAPLEVLSNCKLGYRTKYVTQTAAMVAADKGLLFQMTKTDYETALSYLSGLCGVGPKVANCILLFSMEKYESFPIDVWMRRLMAVLYGLKETDSASMQAYAKEHFGSLGGFAQQYLFYYARQNGIGKRSKTHQLRT